MQKIIGQRFLPDSQGTARFLAAPFQRFEVNLCGVDRSEGELFPTPEGESIYCERSDFPLLFNLVTSGKTIQTSNVFRNGLQIKSAFKGIFISHPFIALSSSVIKQGAAFIIGKVKECEFSNNLGNTALGGNIGWRIVSNTSILQAIAIYVPPGARRIRKFNILLGATTVTSAVPAFFLPDGTSSIGTGYSFLSQTLGTGVVNYNSPNSPPFGIKVSATSIANLLSFDASDVFVPQSAVELQIAITGTGLASILTCECVFE